MLTAATLGCSVSETVAAQGFEGIYRHSAILRLTHWRIVVALSILLMSGLHIAVFSLLAFVLVHVFMVLLSMP